MIFPVCPVISRSGSRKITATPGLGRSVWIQLGNSGLALLGGDPGNAILLNGVVQTANLEIGVPGFQHQVPTSTSKFKFRAARGVRSFKEFWRQSGAQRDRARLRL